MTLPSTDTLTLIHHQMIKDLKDICITSEYFGQDTKLEGILARPFNIVFGHNGSGKSTIADAFAVYSSGEQPEKLSLRFNTELSDEERKRIFVFNEKFIRKNVEVAGDGLDAIVMLGDAGNLSREEAALNGKLDESEANRAAAETAKQVYLTESGKIRGRIEKQLKDNYAVRGRDIKGQSNRIQVKLEEDIFLKKEAALEYSGDILKLSQEVNEGRDRVKCLVQGNSIEWNAPSLNAGELGGKAKILLAQKVEKPELDERDRYIVELMQSGHDFPKLSHEVILGKAADFCPLCQQSIPHGHLATLEENLKRVSKAMSGKVDEYKSELESLLEMCSPFKIDLSGVGDHFADEQNAVNKAVEALNQARFQLKCKIEERASTVFAPPVSFDASELDKTEAELSDAVDRLQGKINEYNEDRTKVKALRENLLEKNKYLAYLENKADIDAYMIAFEKHQNAEKEEQEALHVLDEIKNELKGVHSKMEQTNIALDFINKCLGYIFFSNNRLKLEQKEPGKYSVKSNEQSVSPDRVSVGERNAIALAYYFASTFKGRSEDDRFGIPSVYVIDDPISSLDQVNRVGIMTFLKDQFTNIINGNNASKILIMSHDLGTVEEISASAGWLAGNNQPAGIHECQYYELYDKKLNLVTDRHNYSYRRLIEYVYLYAEGLTERTSGNDSIGNQLRRVMESYSTFMYGMGVQRMLGEGTVLENIPVEYRDFYRRLAAMLVLNSESHASVPNMNCNVYGPSDLRTLARHLLLFIRYTNKTHIECMLGRERSLKIGEWGNDLPNGGMNIQELQQEYSSGTFVVEIDANGRCHCGKCALKDCALDYVGKKVVLNSIQYNRNNNTNPPYPIFGFIREVVADN